MAGVVALCMTAANGCASMTPKEVIVRVLADAAANTATFYATDAKLYGNMVNAAAY